MVPIILVSTSCSDFLDHDLYTPSTDGFFKSEPAIKDGVTGVYQCLYLDHYSFGYRVSNFITLDKFTALSLERDLDTTIGAGPGLSAKHAYVLRWWQTWYQLIARANTVLYGYSKDYTGEPTPNIKQYLAEARVLRALGYYYLIMTYGDVPFFDKPVTSKEFNVNRTPKETIMEFILQEMDQVAPDLQWTAGERGRIDKSVVYGLKARAALFAGSMNYGGKGEHYFEVAADAAYQVIGKRKLAEKFDDLFITTGQQKGDVRSELLLELMFSTEGNQRATYHGFAQVSRFYGQTTSHPSLLLSDTYECIDGKRIDESNLYDPRFPQRNRDPRFRSTFWMHGDTVTGNTTGLPSGRIKFILNAYDRTTKQYDYKEGEWNETTNMDIDSNDAWTSFAKRGCGLIWKKFSADTIEAIGNSTVHFPVMRYAEILLTYAEAKIELNRMSDDGGLTYQCINELRNRAGMPDISADRIGNQNKMRQLVRRERKVELIHEGLHFADMRRWGIGDIENDSPSYGIPINRYSNLSSNDVPYFKKTERHDLNDIASYDAYKSKLAVRDESRRWEAKYALWPIPQDELYVAPNLGQNELWK